METLEQKIEKLKIENNFDILVSEKLPEIKTLNIVSFNYKTNDFEKRIVAECKNTSELKQVLKEFKPTNKSTTINSATKNECILKTPFRINLNNPCSYGNFKIEISYTSKDTDIKIELPVSFVEPFVSRKSRNITDSEYHYFIGYSYNQLRDVKVQCYEFESSQISWYGGNKTLTNEETIKDIIKHLKK